MRDSISIGPTPVDESCVDLGEDNYIARARKECAAFIRQLRRQFGPEPGSAKLKITHNPHDFNTYLDVVCYYDDNDMEGMDYAFRLESETPEEWDEIAKSELELV